MSYHNRKNFAYRAQNYRILSLCVDIYSIAQRTTPELYHKYTKLLMQADLKPEFLYDTSGRLIESEDALGHNHYSPAPMLYHF